MLCWHCILQQPLWNAIWQYLAKLCMHISYDTEISVLVYIPENSCTNQYANVYRKLIIAYFYGNRKHRHPRCPSPRNCSVRCDGYGPKAAVGCSNMHSSPLEHRPKWETEQWHHEHIYTHVHTHKYTHKSSYLLAYLNELGWYDFRPDMYV